ncbi:hypothetical protein D3C75_1194320 [compost metagenome]
MVFRGADGAGPSSAARSSEESSVAAGAVSSASLASGSSTHIGTSDGFDSDWPSHQLSVFNEGN